MSDLTQSELKSYLEYDPSTGIFHWNDTEVVCVRVRGKVAGSVLKGRGYLRICFKGKARFLHRLAWIYFYGVMPEGEIDHIDGDRSNNKINNLRDVSKALNQQNQRKAQKQTSSGYLGVSWHAKSNKWSAAIQINKVQKHLGLFTDPKIAHEAYVAAKRQLHPACSI